MAKAIRVNNVYQQNIIKLLRELTDRYTTWQVWQDFITMAAVCIANVFYHPHKAANEKLYTGIAQKYTANELDIFARMLQEVIDGLEADPEQDFLGTLFMGLDLGNEWRGQFFTPYDVCRAMAAMNVTEKTKKLIADQGWINVHDPACGAGALLVAFANACKNAGINYQRYALFVAQDIDQLAGLMCYIQISLLGCAGYVVIQDTLRYPILLMDERGLVPLDNGNVWYTPMYYSDTWEVRKIKTI